jgi:hypothetical protein
VTDPPFFLVTSLTTTKPASHTSSQRWILSVSEGPPTTASRLTPPQRQIKGNETIAAAVVPGIPHCGGTAVVPAIPHCLVRREGKRESTIRPSILVPPSWLADMPSAGLLPISLDGLPPPPSSAVAGGVVDGEETRGGAVCEMGRYHDG